MLCGFGWVTAARLGKLAMAVVLILAGFERMAAGLRKLAMAAMLCELVVAVAVVRGLAVLERVAVARHCELVVVATLKSDGRAQGRLTCKALGWQVHAKDLWVDRAMVARRQDLKLVTARVRNQR